MSLKRFSFFFISPCLLAGSLSVWLTGTHGQQRIAQTNANQAVEYDVRAFGAKGDGRTLDTIAINKAIDAAAASGGGIVRFRAGSYLSFTIRLKSNISLYLDHGATIIAADPKEAPKESKAGYDLPEPNAWDMYQDFGHSHWQNSLIAGIGLENVSILGPGMINGKGLTRRSPRPRRPTSVRWWRRAT